MKYGIVRWSCWNKWHGVTDNDEDKQKGGITFGLGELERQMDEALQGIYTNYIMYENNRNVYLEWISKDDKGKTKKEMVWAVYRAVHCTV